jgi:hypothetical protein
MFTKVLLTGSTYNLTCVAVPELLNLFLRHQRCSPNNAAAPQQPAASKKAAEQRPAFGGKKKGKCAFPLVKVAQVKYVGPHQVEVTEAPMPGAEEGFVRGKLFNVDKWIENHQRKVTFHVTFVDNSDATSGAHEAPPFRANLSSFEYTQMLDLEHWQRGYVSATTLQGVLEKGIGTRQHVVLVSLEKQKACTAKVLGPTKTMCVGNFPIQVVDFELLTPAKGTVLPSPPDQAESTEEEKFHHTLVMNPSGRHVNFRDGFCNIAIQPGNDQNPTGLKDTVPFGWHVRDGAATTGTQQPEEDRRFLQPIFDNLLGTIKLY